MSSTPPFQSESLLAHAAALRTLARALTWDEATAEDLVQETWLTAMEKRPHSGEGLGAWLRTVMRRRAAHKNRSEATRRERERSVSTSEGQAPIDERKSVVNALASELMQLDEPYQTTLFLRFFEERSVLEIARHFDTTTGTVGSRIHRGLEIMRRRLDARSDGKREIWLGALAPFATPQLRGFIMSGNAKLAVAATALCAVVLFTWQPFESQPRTAPLEHSNEADLARLSSASPRTELAAPERTAVEPIEEAKPPAPLIAQAEPKTPRSAEPVEKDEEVLEELAPGKKRVKREFLFSLSVKEDAANSRFELVGGEVVEHGFDWDFSQTIKATDVFSTQEDKADFVRQLTGKWTSKISRQSEATDFGLIESELLRSSGSSPLNRRKLLFHFDQKNGWVITSRKRKRNDPSDLTQKLRADMDLSELRPSDTIKVGDTWFALEEGLASLFRPAGDMPVEFKDLDDNIIPAERMSGMEEVLTRLGEPLGKLELTATKLKFGDDSQAGEASEQPPLEIKFDAKLITSFANKIELDSYQWSSTGLQSFHQRIEFEGEGKGSWSNEKGLVTNLLIEGKVTIIRTMKMVGADEHEGRFNGTFQIQVNNRAR